MGQLDGNVDEARGTTRTARVRLEVDRTRCAGHGVCMIHAPALFDLDDDGLAFLLAEATDDVTAARAAEGNCPERAITVEEA